MKHIKRALGAAACVAALWAGYSGWVRGASVYAVVVANVSTLRTPIQGVVTHELSAGQRVESGKTLANVDNKWFDDSYLTLLESRLQSVQRSQAALEAYFARLEDSKASMTGKAAARRALQQRQLDALVKEAAAREQAATLAASFAERKRLRAEGLAAIGVASQEALESASLLHASSEAEREGQKYFADSMKIAGLAATKGLTVTNSVVGDAGYAEQRTDSIGLDLLGLVRERDLVQAQQQEIEQRLKAERARAEQLRAAKLTVPSAARVWSVAATTGEYVHGGQPVAELVLCDTLRVYAQVTERTYASLTVGTKARFFPDGGGPKQEGEVVQLTGPWQVAAANLGEARLPHATATPTPDRYGVVLKFAGLARGHDGCTVGRTGSVVFGRWL